MQYRSFGPLDWKPSALGFGAMRLPIRGDDYSQIDEPQAIRMIRYAIDHGVNYVDTAVTYHRGASEVVLGKALQDGYRQQVKLATKLTPWKVEKREDLDPFFEAQLERLQTDYVDFYLFHALREKTWGPLREMKVFDWAERLLADGRIRHLGFSFHDSFDIFQEIIQAYDDWTFCQIQYNYMDVEHQAGTRGLKYAADQGLAVVVMEPIRGGQLAADPPPQPIQELWDSAPCRRTPADWALQWVWNHPEVSLLLSGMSEMRHVRENLASAGRSGPGTLSREELDLVARVREKYRQLAPVPCTKCQYCLPCPNGVNIPRVLEIYNEAIMYNNIQMGQRAYNWVGDEEKGDVCAQCGECLDVCPQEIPITEWLEKAHQVLSNA
jgi:hypothetical protein